MGNATHKFHNWLIQAELFESDWRDSCNQMFEYYEGEQWTEEEIYEIESRKQQATVLNLIRPTIDTLLSIEVSRRSNIQVTGREASDDAMADTLTALLDQIEDESDADYYESQSFREGVIAGRGWVGCGVKKNIVGTDEKGETKEQYDINIEWIPFEECYIDPYHRKPDGSDAKYIIRCVWHDRDEVKKMFGDKIDQSTFDSVFGEDYRGVEYNAQENSTFRYDYYDTTNQRVKLCYCWYKEDGVLKYVVFSDEVFLVGSENGKNKNPLDIQEYPIIPFTCFRKKNGRPMGMVKLLVDAQDQINKLNSKFLWNMSVNRIMAEESATDDPDELRDQWNRPDGLAIVNDGSLGKIRIEENLRESQFLYQQMQFMIQMMQRTSGINDSMFGQSGTNERSAQQQRGRISQGTSMQTSILENLHFTLRKIAKVTLLLIGNFYTEERVVRVTGSNGLAEYIKLNGQDDEGNPVNTIEDIVKYDVIMKEVPPFNGVREIMMRTFSEIAKSGVLPPPIVGEVMLTLSDIPEKEKLIQKLEGFYSAGGGAAAPDSPTSNMVQ